MILWLFWWVAIRIFALRFHLWLMQTNRLFHCIPFAQLLTGLLVARSYIKCRLVLRRKKHLVWTLELLHTPLVPAAFHKCLWGVCAWELYSLFIQLYSENPSPYDKLFNLTEDNLCCKKEHMYHKCPPLNMPTSAHKSLDRLALSHWLLGHVLFILKGLCALKKRYLILLGTGWLGLVSFLKWLLPSSLCREGE